MTQETGPAFRQHVRIAAQDVRVGVRIEETEEWIPAAIGDLSVGGAFLVCDRFIVEGTRVDVGLAFPSGIQIVQPSEVKRVVEASPHGPAGFGVEFLQPSQANQQALRRELDQRLGGQPEPVPLPTAPSPAAARPSGDPPLAQGVLLEELPAAPETPAPAPAQTELTGTIYERLRVPPTVDDRTFAQHFDAFLASVDQQMAAARADSAQHQRLQVFRQSLARLQPITRDPMKRAAYDFRHGILNVEQRLQAARDKSGPPLSRLQQAWARIFPAEVREAKRLLMEAQKGGPDASQLLARASHLDPFNTQTWQ